MDFEAVVQGQEGPFYVDNLPCLRDLPPEAALEFFERIVHDGIHKFPQ